MSTEVKASIQTMARHAMTPDGVILYRVILTAQDFAATKSALGVPEPLDRFWVDSLFLCTSPVIRPNTMYIEQLQVLSYDEYCYLQREDVFTI